MSVTHQRTTHRSLSPRIGAVALGLLWATTVLDAHAQQPAPPPAPTASTSLRTQCVESHGNTQRLRKDGKLVSARDEARKCGLMACPDLVRNDCLAWAGELDAEIPSIVVAAKDVSGNDTLDVAVMVDGVRVADRLSGTALELDPGEHKLQFLHAGALKEQALVVRQGERNRLIEVSFAPDPTPVTPVVVPVVPAPAPTAAAEPPPPPPAPVAAPPPVAPPPPAAPAPAAPSPSTPPADASQQESGGYGLAIAGFVIAGVGLGVGAVTGGLSMSAHSSASALCDEDGNCPEEARADHDNSLTLANVSNVGFIVGGVGAVVGIIGLATGGSDDSGDGATGSLSFDVGPGSLSVSGAF
jgi:hypothetical protein